LRPEEKFPVSHRGEAFQKLLDYLTTCEHYETSWQLAV